MKVDFWQRTSNLFEGCLLKIKFQNHVVIQLLKGIFIIFFFRLFDMVEAEGEDLDDDVNQNFFPIGFFRFMFHKR